MADTLFWSRLQFGFTITYHYLFPQLTMGLAWIIVFFKWRHLRTGDEKFGNAARFWARIFGINFAVGVVTGIPMEFQFGTNWAEFSKFSGNVIGQTLAMEGMFAFFLESAMVGAMVWGEKRLGPRNHFLATVGVALGSWLSGYFILTTNAFMQHPVGYALAADGSLRIGDFMSFMLNPWAFIMFLHNQCAALVTGSFVVAAVGALYALRGKHAQQASLFLKTGTLVGLISCVLVAFPTGDQQAKMVARHQPVSLAAMEGHFHGGSDVPLNFIGQPNVEAERVDNRIYMPYALSFLAFGHLHAKVPGLDDFPKDEWPTNVELLYYAFHIMAGLGTLFILLMVIANFQRWRGKLETSRGLLWALMFAFPFPYIATTAGWMTAELGRQPWLIFHLLRTGQGVSEVVSGGNVLFTFIGFTGLYFVLGLMFLFLVGQKSLTARNPALSTVNWRCPMIEIWYAILAFMLLMFVVLEGFDIGAGLLQYLVGKTEEERRLVITAIGPLWSWHEVWLVGFGGVLFVSFPTILAVSFSGFYLALFLLLWSLLLRGISLEVSGHLEEPLWRTAWHNIFVSSNILLAILIGTALGNVVRGVPLDASGKFSLAFFTNFSPFGRVGILDWYTMSFAVFVLVAFAAHGANALVLKTEGPVHDRSRRLARSLWKSVVVLLAIITVETWRVRPDLFPSMLHKPFAWLGLACVVGGLIAVFSALSGRRELRAVVGSSAFIAGMMIAGAAGVFPIMLHSTLAPENSLSAYGSAAAAHGLAIALVWWPISLILAIGYFLFIYRHYSGKVKPAEDTQQPY